jgi:tRNA nucleotidyltransferase/poly(A) polymerase
MDLAVKEQRQYKDAVQALTSLEAAGFQARLAGGCVRDRLLGRSPADYDIATDARPDAVIRHFAAAGRRTVPTGIDHGTVTLVMPAGPIEITTLRTDVATDGRRAQVAFGRSFEEDAARRDFTINAMFEDARGTVYDFHDGAADLKAGCLRLVGDPVSRIREDYLRILRLFRFWARFGFAPEPKTLAAAAAEKAGLAVISQERISGELLKLLAGEHAHPALQAMAASGVLAAVVPELAAAPLPLASVLACWRAVRVQPGLAVLGGLAALGADLDAAGAAALGARLKLSTAEQKRLAVLPDLRRRLLQPLPDIAARLELGDLADAAAGALDAFPTMFAPVLATAPELTAPLGAVLQELARHGPRRTARLPLDGKAVAAALGLAPGPALGDAVAALKRAYRNGEWTTREQGLAWLAKRQDAGGVK